MDNNISEYSKVKNNLEKVEETYNKMTEFESFKSN
jgi:hypothetical protein